MNANPSGKSGKLVLVSLSLLILFVLACGAAATATPEPPEAAAPTEETGASGTEATPRPQATATPAPEAIRPGGTLEVGQKELGAFQGHPKMAVNPALFVFQTAPVGEGLITIDINAQVQGWLAESWDISEDFTTWTFKLHEGVQFHKGYGEMTAEDVVWSYVEGWAQNQKHARFSDFERFWRAPEGSVEAVDRYTVKVDTGTPLASLAVLETWLAKTPSGSANWVTSKQQVEDVGEEAANRDIAATGPWEIVDHRPNEVWRMQAVADHWRKTPHFAELVFREIPEESARIAGFQTGQLSTFLMAFDSIPVVEEVPGAKLMSVPGAIEYGLNFYGGHYAEAADPAVENQPSYDPALPWVSGDPDVDSEEWAKARMVRQALSLAIDRQSIIDTLLRGFARPIDIWLGGLLLEERLGDRHWPFDPDRAQQLLEEAGYGDGFSITLTPSLRGAPAEVEVCEAIAQMWGDIGIDVDFREIPYSTLRPQLVRRTYQGATCHAAGARVLAVGSIDVITTVGAWNMGATHPFLEQLSPRMNAAVDPEELQRLETDYGAFLFDNALTGIGLFGVDSVWPVGPNIEEWSEHVKFTDLRNLNGFEYIRPR